MDLHEKAAHLSPVWYRYTGIIASHGEGAYIIADDGNHYLDFTCGIGVTNTGHCHPRVVEAIRQQAGKLIHGQANILLNPALLQLVAELSSIFPPQLDGFFFSNSGAEAVEGAVKLARSATGRPNIVVFQGSFHGRTVGTMSLTTSKTIYRSGYQPLMPGVFVAPFPYTYRYGWTEEETSQWCLDELRFLLTTQTSPHETAAFLVEPILGEGGYVVPPKSFLKGLRQIADEYGILLILDEIQSGFGRTGTWFAYEHFDVEADIVTIAKGMASGLPLSGVVAPLKLMEKWPPGSHGGTFGGNVIAAAAAVATIQVIREENLLANASTRGSQLIEGLHNLQESFPEIADVRGLGLMVAAELRTSDRQPNTALAKAVVHACLENGLLLLTCGPWDNTIRFIPPLIVNQEHISQGLEKFEKALAEIKE
ncbi:MAG: aminotransferase class III-fold pyridoxal phosphate-dependent enzyme [Anaerolineales bacterium]|nr:aminotransferase class III-fold pyridoxal phosphate-dependent enzyme [Anaerolineales bacterium]